MKTHWIFSESGNFYLGPSYTIPDYTIKATSNLAISFKMNDNTIKLIKNYNMKSFKSRQDWEASQLDVTPMQIRYRVIGACKQRLCSIANHMYK